MKNVSAARPTSVIATVAAKRATEPARRACSALLDARIIIPVEGVYEHLHLAGRGGDVEALEEVDERRSRVFPPLQVLVGRLALGLVGLHLRRAHRVVERLTRVPARAPRDRDGVVGLVAVVGVVAV